MMIPADLSLEDERVALSPLKQVHISELAPIGKAHPELVRYSPYLIGTREDLDQFISKRLAEKTEETSHSFIIFDKQKQAYAGSTSYLNISYHNARLEIGATWIAPDFQGTGLNKHMKYLMLCYAFETLKMKRVELKTDVRNLQSQRAMEKIGAQYEGKLRSHTLMTDGHRRDTVYYSILAEEWPKIKTQLTKEN